jgi:hypothetical protein
MRVTRIFNPPRPWAAFFPFVLTGKIETMEPGIAQKSPRDRAKICGRS